jgi:serine/threonine protein kinase
VGFEPALRRRLGAESDVLHACIHPAIVRPLAFVETAAYAALVTEHLTGGDLVSTAGAAPRHWARAALDVLDALDYLHARGLVHRDVKARNVMLDATGRARLVDFGSAARIGMPRRTGGTTPAHRYAADGEIKAADDVYAFAVLVYELLSGRLPFGVDPRPRARKAPPVLHEHADADADARALERLVLRTLDARDGRDPGSMSAYRDVLESMAEEADSK